MNNHASESAEQSAPPSTITIINTGLARRYRRERRFRLFGLAAIVGSLMFLVLLLGSIGLKGWTAFVQTRIHLDIHLDPAPWCATPPWHCCPRSRAVRTAAWPGVW